MRAGTTAPVPWNVILPAIARSVGEPLARRRKPVSSRAAFAILVTTMISPRTRDEVTEAAARRLLRRAPTARELSRLTERRIAALIYPAGFYRVKAAHLRAAAAMLVRVHGSRVPASLDALLELPGVGRKIANLVASQAFGIDAICVDTHVHRISNRAGWVTSRGPEQTERALRRILPVRYWAAVNHMLVSFGKRTCTPLSPRCSACPIATCCPPIGVSRSR